MSETTRRKTTAASFERLSSFEDPATAVMAELEAAGAKPLRTSVKVNSDGSRVGSNLDGVLPGWKLVRQGSYWAAKSDTATMDSTAYFTVDTIGLTKIVRIPTPEGLRLFVTMVEAQQEVSR